MSSETIPHKRSRRKKIRHWKRRAAINTYRALRSAERYLPPGTRIPVGLLLMVGGVFGFLPILGFWMLPLGLAVLSLDFPPLRRRLRTWLRKTRKTHHQLDRKRTRGNS